MSDLNSKISELERELALKKAFQLVKFSIPKNLPEDVRLEAEAKLREAADVLALSNPLNDVEPVTSSSEFSVAEIEALKMIAATVLKKALTPSNFTAPQESASSVPTQIYEPPKPKIPANPRKAKILVSENVRGEVKRYAAPEDEIYVPNPDKVDDNGMVSATHMKRGTMFKIPLEDIEFLN